MGLATLSLMTPAGAASISYCGSLENAYGPFDYRLAESQYANEIFLVESHHFTPNIEALTSGNTGALPGELDYTLRAFPNHHRALTSLARLGLRSKNPQLHGMHWSFTCYFDRAMRFQPTDDAVRMIFGTYLLKKGDVNTAIEQLKIALQLNSNNAPANYNLGLAYFQQKNYSEALSYAKKAYSLDYPMPGLKNALVAAGKWDNP